jgi:flagellar hook-length control protein FliK
MDSTTRDAYQAKMKAQLDEWSAKLDVLKAKLAGADANARLDLHHAADELHKLHDAGKQQLAKLSATSAEAWKDAKSGLEEGWTKVSDAASVLWKKVS